MIRLEKEMLAATSRYKDCIVPASLTDFCEKRCLGFDEQQPVNDRSLAEESYPMSELAEFTELSAKLIFGLESPAIRDKRVVTLPCISGTSTLIVAGEFLTKHYKMITIYIPQPACESHTEMFSLAGLCVKTYRYYDLVTHELDFQGLLEDLNSAAPGAAVLLHACAHYPTGIDPTLQQWEKIRQLLRSKALLPVFYCAYLGLASGSLVADAQSVRIFAADGGDCVVGQSYTHNMGFYDADIGALSFVCETAEIASRFCSSLKSLVRPMDRIPLLHGASVVAKVLRGRVTFNEWMVNLKTKSDQANSFRDELFEVLCQRYIWRLEPYR